MPRALIAVCLTVTLLAATAAARADDPSADAPRFERDILPIFTQHCLKCHGLEARKAALDLRTAGLVLTGGDSGPAIVAGDLEKSLLYGHVSDRTMPPEGELPLSDAKIDTIRRWIAAGAPADDAGEVVPADAPPEVTDEDRAWWAFQPLTRPQPPDVQASGHVRTPIDAFLLARLEERGLSFSPEADRLTLVRRLYFDLIGLPPSPEEVDAYLTDAADEAYGRLVERLLASPHFGERWGRHWLDAAGYVDTVGADNDATIIRIARGKWRYRDYVVGAFNRDLPFDRFLTEQLAGDELFDWRNAASYTPQQLELLIATGYLRNVPDRSAEDELNTADIRVSVLYDTMELVGTGLLGLTTQCARCHSHKYDPIPQTDYYRLLAAFTPAFNVQDWVQPEYREGTQKKARYRELADVAPAEQQAIDAHNAAINARVKALSDEIAAIHAARRQSLVDQKLAALPEAVRADTAAALGAAPESRNEVQKYLAEKLGPLVAVSDQEVAAALSAEEQQAIAAKSAESAALEGTRKSYGFIQPVFDVGPPPPTHVFHRGDHTQPGRMVEPGPLAVLCGSEAGFALPEAAPGSPTSGRRLALARWLTDDGTPAGALVSRVMVNRVWMHLFGEGIVRTPGNFGAAGVPPTHPELLEWLAAAYVDGGWSTKSLIRTLVLSSAYRQASYRDAPPADATAEASSAPSVDPQVVDPGNELLWRMRLRRLESETVRDSILAASGRLDRRLGGPALPIDPKADGSVVIKVDELASPGDQWRRSMYILCRRAYQPSLLDVFDQPQVAVNCTGRTPSAVVTQSLAMLNDEFVLGQSESFADRVLQAAGSPTAEARVAEAFRIAFGRKPDAEENGWALKLLAAQAERYRAAGQEAEAADRAALAHLCQMLLNTNEFLYVP